MISIVFLMMDIGLHTKVHILTNTVCTQNVYYCARISLCILCAATHACTWMRVQKMA